MSESPKLYAIVESNTGKIFTGWYGPHKPRIYKNRKSAENYIEDDLKDTWIRNNREVPDLEVAVYIREE